MNIKYRHDLTLTEAMTILNSSMPPWAPCHEEVGSQSERYNTVDFTGTANYSEALKLANDGAQELARIIEQRARELKVSADTETASNAFEVIPDVCGCMVDIPMFLAGEPECMIDVRVGQTKPMIELFIMVSAMASIKAETLAHRGEAVTAIIRALEINGYAVGVTAASKVKSTQIGAYTVRVKDPGQYIDLGKLAFWIAHPSGFRRGIWRIREQQALQELKDTGVMSGSYGSSTDFEPHEMPEDCIYLKKAVDEDNDKTAQQMFNEIREQLAARNITIN